MYMVELAVAKVYAMYQEPGFSELFQMIGNSHTSMDWIGLVKTLPKNIWCC
jgi:hypothetical protein